MKRCLMVMAVIAGLGVPTIAQADTRVAVLDLDAGPGAGPAAVRVSKALRRQVANTSGLAIAAGKTLAEIKLIFGCTERPRRAYHRCLAKAGKSMSADKIVVGKVRKSGSRIKVVLTLVDVSRPLRPRTVSERISRGDTKGAGLRGHARNWIARLFGKGRTGTLSVTCSTDDVQVSVGGNVLGTCSSAGTKITLSPGTHKVTFTKSGFKTSSHVVSVTVGRTSELSVELVKRRIDSRLPPDNGGGSGVVPPKKKTDGRLVYKVLFYSTLVAGVALLASSIYTGLQVNKAVDDKWKALNALEEQGIYPDAPDADNVCDDHRNDPALLDACNRGTRMAVATNVLIGVGSAMLVGSAVFLYFAYIAKGKKEEKAAALGPTFSGPGKSRIMVTPQVWVRGGGLSATLRF